MPALAGLLIVVGYSTIKPHAVMAVARTGPVQATVMTTTLVLTMLIPLQYAVLVGVGISIILHVAQQSTRLTTKQLIFTDDGRRQEVDPPEVVPPNEVIVLQPYGSMFFATVPTLEQQMPTVTPTSTNSVVILRARGADEMGATLSDVLGRYATSLRAVGSRFVLVTDNPLIRRQLDATGTMDLIGEENVYLGTAWLGETVRRAHDEALDWVQRSSAADEEIDR